MNYWPKERNTTPKSKLKLPGTKEPVWPLGMLLGWPSENCDALVTSEPWRARKTPPSSRLGNDSHWKLESWLVHLQGQASSDWSPNPNRPQQKTAFPLTKKSKGEADSEVWPAWCRSLPTSAVLPAHGFSLLLTCQGLLLSRLPPRRTAVATVPAPPSPNTKPRGKGSICHALPMALPICHASPPEPMIPRNGPGSLTCPLWTHHWTRQRRRDRLRPSGQDTTWDNEQSPTWAPQTEDGEGTAVQAKLGNMDEKERGKDSRDKNIQLALFLPHTSHYPGESIIWVFISCPIIG